MASAPTRLTPVTLEKDPARRAAFVEPPPQLVADVVDDAIVLPAGADHHPHDPAAHELPALVLGCVGLQPLEGLETFRLRSVQEQSSLLPDVIVNCEPLTQGATSLERPIVLVEVLSSRSSRRDRDEKRAVYRTLSSLRHYMMVTRNQARIEALDHHDGFAAARVVEGLDAELALPAIDITLPLASIYRDVLAS